MHVSGQTVASHITLPRRRQVFIIGRNSSLVSLPVFSSTNEYILFSSQIFTEFLLGTVLGAEVIKVHKTQSTFSQNI